MICTSCGNDIPKHSEYCPNCGTKVAPDVTPKFARPPEEYQGPRRLYRSRKNRMVAGVCGGIGEYYNVDPTFIRLIWAFFILIYGFGILAYIVALVIIPESPLDPWVEPR